MGAPLSPLWPGGPRGARTGDWRGREREKKEEGGRKGGRGGWWEEEGGAAWLPL